MYAKEPGLATSICGDRKDLPGNAAALPYAVWSSRLLHTVETSLRHSLLVRGLLVMSTAGRPTWDRAFRIWKNSSRNSARCCPRRARQRRRSTNTIRSMRSRTRRSTRAISSSSISSASSWKFVCGWARESACAGKQFGGRAGRAGGVHSHRIRRPLCREARPETQPGGEAQARPRADRGPRALPPAQAQTGASGEEADRAPDLPESPRGTESPPAAGVVSAEDPSRVHPERSRSAWDDNLARREPTKGRNDG